MGVTAGPNRALVEIKLGSVTAKQFETGAAELFERILAAKGQAAIDPAAAPTEQLGDLRGGKMVVVGQRTRRAGLVHGIQRAAGSIGLEQAALRARPGAHSMTTGTWVWGER